MADYVYRRVVRRHWYRRFKIRRRTAVVFASIVLIAVGLIVADLLRSNKTQPETSTVQDTLVENELNTFRSTFFQFQDTGKWVLMKNESNGGKYVYYKYNGNELRERLAIYVNRVPIALNLAVSRVLPVRIVNSNSFDVTSVSGQCGILYAPGELHKVKVMNIQGADMLCDPDTPQYTVELAEINGDYKLQLQRANGAPISFVIIYRDLTFDPSPEPLIRIANSFKSL